MEESVRAHADNPPLGVGEDTKMASKCGQVLRY